MELTRSDVSPVRLWTRLWNELDRAEQGLLCLAVLAMVGGSGVTAMLPVLLGGLVDQTLSRGQVSLAGSVGSITLIAGLVIVQQSLQVVRRQLVESVSTGFERDGRVRAYEHLLRLDLDHVRHGQVGRIYGRANRSIEGAVKLVKLGGMDLLPAVMLACFAIVVAFARNPLVGAAMFGVVPTGFVLVRWQVRNQAGVRLTVRDHKESVDGQVVELLPALETIRATGAEGHFVGRIHQACNRLRETELRHHRAMSLFDAAKSLNEAAWLIVVLCVAIKLTANGTISAGDVTTYVLLFASVLAPLRELHRIVDEASESAQQAQDLFNLLDEPEDVVFRPSEPHDALTADRAAPMVIEALDVRFTHRRGQRQVLSGIDLAVKPGERIGLVGPSGCGKSTLLKLIARLDHGYTGEIVLGGANLATISHSHLVATVGYVAQEPRIFRMTVLDNILLGRTEFTMEDVVRASRQAQIHETILAMSQGYDTPIGERGDTLSGGQRQRICLARALLGTPHVLLLDEPTSALDSASERAVQEAIDALDGISMVIVAHRLSTLRNVDRILVIDAGRIVEEGSFDDLGRRGGRFSEMLAAQDASVSTGMVVPETLRKVGALA